MMQSMNLQTILFSHIEKREEIILKEMKKIDEIKEANRLKEKSVVPKKKGWKMFIFTIRYVARIKVLKAWVEMSMNYILRAFFHERKKKRNIIKLYEYLQINRYKNL